MDGNDQPDNNLYDLMSLLINAPLRYTAAAVISLVALGTAIAEYGPLLIKPGVADDLCGGCYWLAGCIVFLRLLSWYFSGKKK